MFFSTLVSTLLKAVLLAAVAVGGVLAGKKLRDSKKDKAGE